MILFLNDDSAYRHWVTHHRQGFVLEGRWKPRWSRFVLHRAGCELVKTAARGRTHATSSGRFKGCANDYLSLAKWVSDIGGSAQECSNCAPSRALEERDREPHLTRLDQEILDYVLEAAAIHLEENSPLYRVTAGDIAVCLGRRSGHVAQSLARLIADGLVVVPGAGKRASRLAARRLVLPTARALRRLEGFTTASDEQLDRECFKLRGFDN